MNGKFTSPYIAFGWCMDVTEKTIKRLEGQKFNCIEDVRKASHELIRVLSTDEFVKYLNSPHDNLNHYWFATVYIVINPITE